MKLTLVKISILVAGIFTALFYSAQLDHIKNYKPQGRDISSVVLTPIQWRSQWPLNLTVNNFLRYTANRGYSPHSGAGVMSYLPEFLKTSPLDGNPDVFIDQNSGTFRFPKASVIQELNYPSIFACDATDNTVCLFGLDERFRQQSWWYKTPLLRNIVPIFSPNTSKYVSRDTYLAVYKIPDEQRRILTNPCVDREIVAYQFFPSKTAKNALDLQVLCADGTAFQSDVVLP